MPEGLDSLLPVRRRALAVALLLADPGSTGPDARAIGMALLDVLRRLSEFGSVRLGDHAPGDRGRVLCPDRGHPPTQGSDDPCCP